MTIIIFRKYGFRFRNLDVGAITYTMHTWQSTQLSKIFHQFIYVLVGHKINFLKEMLVASTNSCNMSDNVDLLVATICYKLGN